jgi:hypothetical protein
LAFLDAILNPRPGWSFASEPNIKWFTEREGEAAFRVLNEFVSVTIHV